jgi:hypothetical protein
MYIFKKQDPNKPLNINLRIMHIINIMAIVLFVGGIAWKLVQFFILKK